MTIRPAPAALFTVVVAASSIQVFPDKIDAVSFVPFCALVGGLASAFGHVLRHGFERFPRQESFRGVFLGALFGLFFVAFGSLNA